MFKMEDMENSKRSRVGVIFGGLSAEAEVSLATGRYVYSLLDPQRFDGFPFYLDKMGQLWLVPDKLVIQNTTLDLEARLARDGTRVNFESLPERVDCVFNALLGKYGEDGCVQGVLELLGVPYTGSGILASALGMDKKIHKKLLKDQGFLVAEDLVMQSSKFQVKSEIENLIHQLAEKIESSFGYPCVVKPTREGSSIGVSVVKSAEGLETALATAFQYDNEVLVEEYLRGMEYTCVVWGNENPQAMLPTEVVFEGDFFTYEGKYMPGKARTITPARVSEEVLREIQRIAVDIYKLIGCVGYGRVDGFVVRKGADQPEGLATNPSGFLSGFEDLKIDEVDIYVTEPHTGTIMVPSSFVFQQAAKFKIELQQKFTGKKVSTPMTPRLLVTKIIELALEAHQSKKGLL